MCVALKNGPRPRIVISVAPPFSRCDAAPVIDSSASPIESAGRSPMSSADKPSTTVVDSRLIEIWSCIVRREPTTSITSTSSAAVCSCVSCASTEKAAVLATPAMNAALTQRAVGFRVKGVLLFNDITISPLCYRCTNAPKGAVT